MTDAPAPRASATPAGHIQISHSPREGTLAYGTAKGDQAGPLLRANHFRWSGGLNAHFIRHSRDRDAQMWKINAAAQALRAAGYEVTVSVDNDDERRFAEAEEDRNDRAADRAERFDAYASNAAGRSAAAYSTAKDRASRIPFGQPVLADHYSAKSDMRYRERIDAGFRRSFEEADRAAHWSGRATAAADYQRHRENPGRTLRRIEKLEADRRAYERALKGDPTHGWDAADPEQAQTLARRIRRLDDELGHWREIIARAEADGVKIWGRADFTKGDFVRFFGRWFEVLRVNAKSLTVPHIHDMRPIVTPAGHPYGPGATYTVKYDEVRGRRSAAEMAAKLAAAREAEPGNEDGPASGS
jgi:hypothetical protein